MPNTGHPWRQGKSRPGNGQWDATASPGYTVTLRRPHGQQKAFVESEAKRNIVRAGRRSGKTVGASTVAVKGFLDGYRVLYGSPTSDQIAAFWFETKRALRSLIDAEIVKKNEVDHLIEVPDTEQRIRAKTVWNADTLRGDFADVLLLDEYQLMDESAWELVGAPMLLDNNGTAYFFYTPPSLRSRSTSKARDPRHATYLYRRAAQDESGRWAVFNFTSHDNPHISAEALADIANDMTALGVRQEIYAEEIDDAPGALWTRVLVSQTRVSQQPELVRLAVAVDPPSESKAKTSGAGIVVGGVDRLGHGYLLADLSINNATPSQWGKVAVDAYQEYEADRIIAETNHGGEMVEHVIRSIDQDASFKAVKASRGKQIRAEPVAAKMEQGYIHHVGEFPKLEDELCMWEPGDESPHRLDAYVWLFTHLLQKKKPASQVQSASIKRSLV